MLAIALLLAQAAAVASLAGWIVSGVIDNWRHPRINQDAVEMVMRLDLLERDFPSEFDAVKHRRVRSSGVVRLAFLAIVLWETLTAILLVLASGLLLLSVVGIVDPEVGRAWGLVGAAAFVITWAGFLVGGNYFCYWYGHFPAQATHFFLAIWGTVAMVLLSMS